MTETLKRKEDLEDHAFISLCRELDEHKKSRDSWMERALIAEEKNRHYEELTEIDINTLRRPHTATNNPRYFIFGTEVYTLTELARKYCLSTTILNNRLKKGAPIDKAILSKEEYKEWKRCG